MLNGVSIAHIEQDDVLSRLKTLSTYKDIIIPTLKPNEIKYFKKVCIKQPKEFWPINIDLFFQPFLDLIIKTVPTLSTLAPVGQEQSAWRYPLFKIHFAEASLKQWDEVLQIKILVEQHKINLHHNLQTRWDALFITGESATNIGQLHAFDMLLDDINLSLITPHIKTTSNTLTLCALGLTRIPSAFFSNSAYSAYWETLKIIDISNNFIRYLPDELSQCIALEELAATHNQLIVLPASLPYKKLKSLSLNNNQFRVLPESLGQCTQLEWLDVAHNQLVSLFESVGQCAKLQSITCSYNKLHALPNSLMDCKKLTHFICNDNLLKSFPESLHFTNLKKLNFSNNQISYFPKGQYENLLILDCHNNKLSHLPNTFEKLENLVCSNNLMTFLPTSLDKCLMLNIIDCKNNFLWNISSTLKEKLGQDWADTMFNQQESYKEYYLGNILNNSVQAYNQVSHYLPSWNSTTMPNIETLQINDEEDANLGPIEQETTEKDVERKLTINVT